jgi:acetyl-CoA carboxylase biotin carboxyl carrier protein
MPEKPSNGKFDTGLIRELAAILREADLGEIEVQQGDLRIKVVKPETKTVYAAAAPAYAAPAPVAAAAPAPLLLLPLQRPPQRRPPAIIRGR